MIENHAAMKWERLANEYLRERDECLDLATKNRETADRYRSVLELIRDNTRFNNGVTASDIAREVLDDSSREIPDKDGAL